MRGLVLLLLTLVCTCQAQQTVLMGRIVDPKSLALADKLHQSAAANSPDSRRYERISLSRENLDKAYYLLLHYLRNPQDALTLRSLHIYAYEGYDEDIENELLEFQNGDEAQLITDAVARLDLEDTYAKNIREALFWKGRELAANQLGYKPPMTCPYRLYTGHYSDAVAALIIAMAPNIQNLTIHDVGHSLNHMLMKNNHGLTSPPLLQNLRHVRFTRYDYTMFWDQTTYNKFSLSEAVRMFHRLPSIESFSLTGAHFDYEGEFFLPGSSNVKKLYLDHCRISTKTLITNIRSPKALEDLRISVGGRIDIHGYSSSVSPMYAGFALYHHRNTLRVLDLDLDDAHTAGSWAREGMTISDSEKEQTELLYEYADVDIFPTIHDYFAQNEWQWDTFWETDVEMGYYNESIKHPNDTRVFGSTIGSLAEFTALKSLSIGVKYLLGAHVPTPFRLIDALPSGLEHLQLRGYVRGINPDHDAQVEELLEHRSERLPNLVTIDGIDEEIPSSVNGGMVRLSHGHYRSAVRPWEEEKYADFEKTPYFEEPLEPMEWLDAP